jgi:RHS repeat-associated protein
MVSTTYTNDAFGARTAKVGGDSWTYSYDGESRLTRVAKNGATQVDCVYDGNGMRVKKVENGKTTYYVYSGANPLLEYSPTDGTYLYRIYAGKKAVAEEKAGVVKFYHKDHLGSTRVVTNAAGAKIAEYKFAPYGEKEVASGDGTEYGFTDKAKDASTGLKYFGARFYDAETGRFLTADLYSNLPNDERLVYIQSDIDEDEEAELFYKKIIGNGLANPIAQNRYIYCADNPLRNVDPDGRAYEATATVAATGWGLCVVDGPVPFGDAVYAGAVITTALGETVVLFGDKIAAAIDAVSKMVEASKNKGKKEEAEHTKNARPSTRNKHEEGKARKGRDKGGEKGDDRRSYRGGKNTKQSGKSGFGLQDKDNEKDTEKNNLNDDSDDEI